jgi:hypothetical protein
MLSGEKFYHHREQKPNLLQAVYRVSHTMSPGEANNTNAPDASGELSEVLWAGGYKNSASLTEEKFVELKTKGDGTLELEIQIGTKLSRFYIPVSGLDAFTVLSKSNFQCFLNSRSIVSDKLSLSDDVTTLRLKADGKNLQEIKYFPLRDNGYNNTTQKIRASFSNSGINSIWRSSTKPLRISIAPDCQGQIFATPEASNEFEPFLADEIFDHQGNGRFYLAASVFDLNLPYIVKFYSHLPQEEAFLSLEKTGIASLLKPVVSILSTNGLFYQKLENYSDLKLYNRDGIFIEGIMTNPMNPQNEWILFCNRSKVNRDMADYEIEDEDSPDRIDSYFKRKKLNLPSGVSAPAFLGNSTNLSPGQCGYLVDPGIFSFKFETNGNSANSCIYRSHYINYRKWSVFGRSVRSFQIHWHGKNSRALVWESLLACHLSLFLSRRMKLFYCSQEREEKESMTTRFSNGKIRITPISRYFFTCGI